MRGFGWVGGIGVIGRRRRGSFVFSFVVVVVVIVVVHFSFRRFDLGRVWT